MEYFIKWQKKGINLSRDLDNLFSGRPLLQNESKNYKVDLKFFFFFKSLKSQDQVVVLNKTNA